MGKIKDLKRRIVEAKAEKLEHVKAQNFEKAIAARTMEKDLENELEEAIKHKLRKKILTKYKRKLIEDAILKVAWTENTTETRKNLCLELTTILGFAVQDITTDELVYRGFACFRGYDAATNKVIDITIAPTEI